MEKAQQFAAPNRQKRKKKQSPKIKRSNAPMTKTRKNYVQKMFLISFISLLCFIIQFVFCSYSVKQQKSQLNDVIFPDERQLVALDLQRIGVQHPTSNKSLRNISYGANTQNVPVFTVSSQSLSSTVPLLLDRRSGQDTLGKTTTENKQSWTPTTENLDASSSRHQAYSECALILQRTYIGKANEPHE